MAKTPLRVGIETLDNNLKQLIETSVKIFPVDLSYVTAGTNPEDFKFVRITSGPQRNNVYIWRYDVSQWELIGADDKEIPWGEIIDKPETFPPSTHSHDELHNHSNKSILDSITQLLINAWNNAVEHVGDLIRHITTAERDLWNTVTDKANITDVNTALAQKSDILHGHSGVYQPVGDYSFVGHLHDGRYYQKNEVDAALSGKANTFLNRSVLDKITEVISHTSYDLSMLYDLDDRLWLIENGYSEGHTHAQIGVLEALTDDGAGGLLYNGQEISGGVTSYNDLTDVPLTFPPQAHVHVKAEITDFAHNHDLVYATLSHNHDGTYSLVAHNHTGTYQPVGNYSLQGHDHDGRYHTKSEITGLLSGKSDVGHGHTEYVSISIGTMHNNADIWYKEV